MWKRINHRLRRKSEFNRICSANKLQLSYEENKAHLGTLKEIFQQRFYADYFPFYQKATIVDIGAHVGYFSLFASKNTDKESTVVAIEPGKTNFEQLERNIQRNNSENITAMHAAIDSASGTTKLHLGKSQNHSLLPAYSLATSKHTQEIEAITIEKLITDNQIEHIDFLKLDCEGSEYRILEHLPREIYAKINVISMEFHDLKSEKYHGEFLTKLLQKNSFQIAKFDYLPTNMNLNYGKIVALNQVFLP